MKECWLSIKSILQGVALLEVDGQLQDSPFIGMAIGLHKA